MTRTLGDLLRQRADSVWVPPMPLDDLVAQGDRRVRRRRIGAAAAAVAAAAVVAGTALAIAPGKPGAAPAHDPGLDTPPARPLTYAVEGTIHYGDQIIETGLNLDELDVTDDGVVFRGLDDEHIMFTDGSDPVEIGISVPNHGDAVASGSVGSLLAWFTSTNNRKWDGIVVYDTHEQAVVAQLPVVEDEHAGNFKRLFPPVGDAVYWTEGTGTGLSPAVTTRYDVSAQTQTTVSRADYLAELESSPRTLVGGNPFISGYGASVAPSRLIGSGSRLDTIESVHGLNGRRLSPYFDSRTGERLRLDVPTRYDGTWMWPFQWLDDDRFAIAATRGDSQAPTGELLVCRISAGDCRVAVDDSAHWLLPVGGIGTQD